MWAKQLSILLVLSVCQATPVHGCPAGCTCTMVGRGRKKAGASDLAASTPIGRRVICRSGDALTSVEQVSPSTLETDSIVLDLSGNAIKVIRSGSFMGLSMLQKLDLSDNQISQIEAGAFLGLDNLLRLNLSSNQLGRLGKGIFDGIPKLERLSLSGNQIKGLPQGIFDNLPVLKKVDFQSDFLVCDCNLQWIVKWLKLTRVQLRSSTVCAVPKQLKGKTVKSLKKKDYHCNWPVELPLFELTPATSQVVFQGDKLPFVCRASVIDSSTRMVWVREDQPVLTNKTAGIFVHTRYSPDRTVMINSLVLERLAVKDSGIWQCRVQTHRGNVSKTVNIVVISANTLYCRRKVTRTNKGTFTWPKTVAGVTAVALCETGRASGYIAPSPPRAYHTCSSEGGWEDLTVDQCQYESEVTRVLEQYAKFDLENMTKLVSRANQLKGYLKTAKTITDKMDVIFTSRIVERLGGLVRDYERLSDIILHIVSVMMSADDTLLLEAQKEEAACSRMVRAVESIPKQLLKEKKVISRYVDNIALEAHNVNSETFPGITCTTYAPQNRPGIYHEDSLSCTGPGNHSDKVREGQTLEASVRIPADIFKNVHCIPVCSHSFKLQFVAYKNSKLFPVLGHASSDMVVKSSVISARIVGATVVNMSTPIVVKLLTRETGTDHTAVYWDFEAQKGLGRWVTRGCTLQSLGGDTSLIRCTHMKSFAVMQSWQTATSSLHSWLWGCFNMGAAIYAGTSVLAVCVMATLITYIIYHGSIKMPRKSRHAVANLCIGLLLLCVTFTLGIHTEQPRLACHVIGIIIHYLSLVTLAWITILTYTIYKKFSKAVQPPPLPEDLPDNPPLPKPILGFYLVGWGVAMLVCGITAAISLEHYITGNQYCFLSTEARMFALYAPAAFLTSICIIFFLSMCCLLREGSHDPADLVDDISDHLPGNELDSVTPTTNLTNTTAPSSSVMDLEYRPVVQLYGVAMVLFLYLFTWMCGAFVVALPFGSLLPHRQMIYNYLYSFTSAALGIFILVFYCLAREDARGCWRNSCCKKDVQSESVATATNPSNGHIARHRGSIELSISGKSSNSTNRSPSVRCGAPKVTNVSSQAAGGGTATDLSLGSYQEHATFYNPRQNGIAKKYWQKNRLRNQLHKGLNTGSGPLMHGQGDGSRTFSDDSFKRRSYGNGIDANTHLSIEIELQPKNTNFCPPGDGPDHLYGGLAAAGKYPDTHPGVGALYLPRGCTQLTPIPGTRSPAPEVPTNSYPVLPSHITAMYSLPQSTLHDDQPLHVNEFMQRNGSVPRLRDFDGQSHVSSHVTSSHDLGAASVNSDARTVDTINDTADERCPPSHVAVKEPPPRIAPKPPLSSFMDQLQQRIPPSNESGSSTLREHSRKPDASADMKVLPSSEKPPRHPSSKSPPLQTLESDHPPCVPVVKASYAAVCQLSREASMERLLPPSQRAASQDPDESQNLLPKGHPEGHDPDDEGSNGEVNFNDIWVPRKEKTKNETSV